MRKHFVQCDDVSFLFLYGKGGGVGWEQACQINHVSAKRIEIIVDYLDYDEVEFKVKTQDRLLRKNSRDMI